MCDTEPYYKRIPEHDGEHRVFERAYPQRPFAQCVTSTIEAVSSADFMTHLCRHRVDSEDWHVQCDVLSPPTYSSCLNAVTAFIDHNDPVDMVVLEGGRGILKEAVEPKLYRVPLPTTRGINHIVWCDSMEITHRDHRYLENIVYSLPDIPYHAINQKVVATISFPEVGTGTLYNRLGNETHLTRVEWSPGDYNATQSVIEHVPYLEAIVKPGEEIPTGIRIQQRWVHVVNQRPLNQGDWMPTSLFAQAYLHTSAHLDGIWESEGMPPPYLKERYIHLRYKPNVNIAVNPYRYIHGWPEGRDIRTLFKKRLPPCHWSLGRFFHKND